MFTSSTRRKAPAATVTQLAQNHVAQPLASRQPKLPVPQNVDIPNTHATRGRPATALVRRVKVPTASIGANNALERSLAAQGPVTRDPPAQVVSVNAGVSNSMVLQVPVRATDKESQLWD